MWSNIFNALSVSICAVCLIMAIWNVRVAIHERESLVRRVRSLESSMDSVKVTIEENSGALSEVANRVKMMRVRAAANHTGSSPSEPDPYRDPDNWRKSMNSKIQKAKLGL